MDIKELLDKLLALPDLECEICPYGEVNPDDCNICPNNPGRRDGHA